MFLVCLTLIKRIMKNWKFKVLYVKLCPRLGCSFRNEQPFQKLKRLKVTVQHSWNILSPSLFCSQDLKWPEMQQRKAQRWCLPQSQRVWPSSHWSTSHPSRRSLQHCPALPQEPSSRMFSFVHDPSLFGRTKNSSDCVPSLLVMIASQPARPCRAQTAAICVEKAFGGCFFCFQKVS